MKLKLLGFLFLFPLTLVACTGAKFTKVDLTEQQMQEVRKHYPNAVSGFVLIKTEPEKAKGK